jgi:hypothetical protein
LGGKVAFAQLTELYKDLDTLLIPNPEITSGGRAKGEEVLKW